MNALPEMVSINLSLIASPILTEEGYDNAYFEQDMPSAPFRHDITAAGLHNIMLGAEIPTLAIILHSSSNNAKMRLESPLK
jgi:hypothetical protein